MRGCTLRALLFGAGLMAAVALPSTALAQADDRPPSTRAIGEEYHIEVGGAIWRPGLFGLIASEQFGICLLYTSPSPRDRTRSRMPSSA